MRPLGQPVACEVCRRDRDHGHERDDSDRVGRQRARRGAEGEHRGEPDPVRDPYRRADPAGRPDPALAVQDAGEESYPKGGAELGGRERVGSDPAPYRAAASSVAHVAAAAGERGAPGAAPSRPATRRSRGPRARARRGSPRRRPRCRRAPGRRAAVASWPRPRPPRARRRRRRYVSWAGCACGVRAGVLPCCRQKPQKT